MFTPTSSDRLRKLDTPPQRADFIVRHFEDLDKWAKLPFALAIIVSPLYSHRGRVLPVVVLAGAALLGIPFQRSLAPHLEAVVGWKAVRRASSSLPQPKGFIAKHSVASTIFLLFVLFAALSPWLRSAGTVATTWFEAVAGAWAVLFLFDCVRQAADRSNPVERRTAYVIGVLALFVCWTARAKFPGSAAIFVVIACVYVALAAFDLLLLLRLAKTSVRA